jgi:hypothetical protein
MGRVAMISMTGESFSSRSFTRQTVAGLLVETAEPGAFTSVLAAKPPDPFMRSKMKRLRSIVAMRKILNIV